MNANRQFSATIIAAQMPVVNYLPDIAKWHPARHDPGMGIEHFPRNLFDLRKRAGLRQKELAHLAGLDDSSISRYESGQRTPGSEELNALAQALATTTDELLKAPPIAGIDVMPTEATARFEARIASLEQLVSELVEQDVWEEVQVTAEGAAGRDWQTMADENVVWHVQRRLRQYPGPRQALKVKGNCLSPSINPGDIVIVDPDVPWRPGQTIALRIDGGVQVKRLVSLGEQLVVESNDGRMVIDQKDGRIAGVVVGRQEAIPF